MHVRYDGEHFPQDLHFQVTPDRSNFQGRYVIHHPQKDDKGMADCEESGDYFAKVVQRRKDEIENCERLTGWDLSNRFMEYVGPYEVLRKKYDKGAIPILPEPKIPFGWIWMGICSLFVTFWAISLIKQKRFAVGS